MRPLRKSADPNAVHYTGGLLAICGVELGWFAVEWADVTCADCLARMPKVAVIKRINFRGKE